MALPTSLKLGKTKKTSSTSTSQSSASALQRALHKSTFLYGPAPPTTGKLTPEQVREFLDVLSLPVNTPMLTTRIAKLPSPLSRSSQTLPVSCLCNTHGWFDLQWIDEMTEIVGGEIGPHLDHLRSAPNWLTSVETKEILGMLDPYAHIFPARDLDGSRMANPHVCEEPTCRVCRKFPCKACRLSIFFQNKEAVKALNICAKGRKKSRKLWPVSCSWLDPQPKRSGWASAWKREGLPVLSDRIIARRWRKSGRQEKMTEEMKSVQSEVIADRDLAASILEREEQRSVHDTIIPDRRSVHSTINPDRSSAAKVPDRGSRQSVRSALVDSDSVIDDITGRPWSVRDPAMRSSDTLGLLRKLGLDDDNREEPAVRGSYHQVDNDDDDDLTEPLSPYSRRKPHASNSQIPSNHSYTESRQSFNSRSNGHSQAASNRGYSDGRESLDSRSHGRPASSNRGYPDGRDSLLSRPASTRSRDSVSSWNSHASRGSTATLRAPAASSTWTLRNPEASTNHHNRNSSTSRPREASVDHSSSRPRGNNRDRKHESVDSWAHFNSSPLSRDHSSMAQAQSEPHRSRLDVSGQPERRSRYSAAPEIPVRSSARSSRRSHGMSSATRERESVYNRS